jgi:nucleoside-diphosphate-sugar epimerase
MILVTGADGFIGSHIAESLVKKGYKVRAFVFYNSFNSWGWLDQSALKNEMEIFPGDIRDPYLVREAVRGCDSIIHLAALIGIPYSYISPNSYVDTNIIGTLNLLNAYRRKSSIKWTVTLCGNQNWC